MNNIDDHTKDHNKLWWFFYLNLMEKVVRYTFYIDYFDSHSALTF